MTESYFRGYWAIGEVAAKVKKLAEHHTKFHPEAPVLRLYRKDYDLIVRWPKAGRMHGFDYVGDCVKFMGYELSFDRTAPRYEQHA